MLLRQLMSRQLMSSCLSSRFACALLLLYACRCVRVAVRRLQPQQQPPYDVEFQLESSRGVHRHPGLTGGQATSRDVGRALSADY